MCLTSREEADRHAGYDAQLTTGVGQNEHSLQPPISPQATQMRYDPKFFRFQAQIFQHFRLQTLFVFSTY